MAVRSQPSGQGSAPFRSGSLASAASSPIPVEGAGFAVDVRPWRTMGAAHWHDCLEITFVLRGHGVFVLGEERLPLHDGDLFVIPAGVPHRTLDALGCRHWNLTLYLRPEAVVWLGPDAERAVRRAGLLSGRRRAGAVAGNWESLFADLAQLAGERQAPDRPMIATKLLEACLLVERCPAQPESLRAAGDPACGCPLPLAEPGDGGSPLHHVREMLSIIEAAGPHGVTAPAVAARVGLNRHYASDLFRHAVGMPLTRYLRRRRLQRAYQLVGSMDIPFADIARCCGFGDVSAFYRAFVKEFGRTPGAVRRLTRGRAG
jgi:AraC-like DNA-binding protein